jgi:hypothetical protein
LASGLAQLTLILRQPLDRLDPIAHFHFLEEVSDVVLDRADGQAEPSRDLLVGQPLET